MFDQLFYGLWFIKMRRLDEFEYFSIAKGLWENNSFSNQSPFNLLNCLIFELCQIIPSIPDSSLIIVIKLVYRPRFRLSNQICLKWWQIMSMLRLKHQIVRVIDINCR